MSFVLQLLDYWCWNNLRGGKFLFQTDNILICKKKLKTTIKERKLAIAKTYRLK